MPASVRHFARLAPLRGNSHQDLTLHLAELNRRMQELHSRIDELQGHSGTPTFRAHADFDGNRLMNVGPTRSDRDAPNVAELRTHAMYARNGVHEAEYLIVAKHGIRTLNPAKADADLLPLGQFRRILFDAGIDITKTNAPGGAGAAVAFSGAAVQADAVLTTIVAGTAFPAQPVTLVNGANPDVYVGPATFFRIVGPTAGFSIGGFAQGADGRWLKMIQPLPLTLTMLNEDAGTLATNRILTGTGADLVMDNPGTTEFWYDIAIERWVVL